MKLKCVLLLFLLESLPTTRVTTQSLLNLLQTTLGSKAQVPSCFFEKETMGFGGNITITNTITNQSMRSTRNTRSMKSMKRTNNSLKFPVTKITRNLLDNNSL